MKLTKQLDLAIPMTTTMKSGAMATPILLLLLGTSLLLAVAAHGEAETTTTTNIRLPSDNVDGSKTDKPWGKCCDNIKMSPLEIFPPLYRCNDEVKQCAAACKECVEAPGDFPRGAYVCRDWYPTADKDPGPKCTSPPAPEKKKRPWGKCCDNIEMSPLRIFPPLYRCNDEVKQCAAACESCEETPGDFPRSYICRDWYQTTDPGPFCTERPWGKCCDTTQCTKSIPPICRCMDEVKRCAAACTKCRRVKSSSKPPRYVCLDQFTGQPGPRCTPADTHN